MGFLKFYGIEFNYFKYGISIRNGGFLFKKKDVNKFLCIENFLEIDKDIGKSCFHFNEIRNCFKIIYEKYENNHVDYAFPFPASHPIIARGGGEKRVESCARHQDASLETE